MIDKYALEHCLAFINCQLMTPVKQNVPVRGMTKMAVTISRQTGSGAKHIAARLAEYLQASSLSNARPWAVFDRNLVEKVLEDNHLPARLAQFMPEDRVSEFNDMLEEALGMHPSASTLVHKTTETIMRLADLGNVIVIGRGGNVITARLKHVFHVRLTGSVKKRVEQLMREKQFGYKEGLDFLEREDLGRARYLKKYFDRDINDATLYDLVINTDRFTHEAAARLIGDAVLNRAMERQQEK